MGASSLLLRISEKIPNLPPSRGVVPRLKSSFMFSFSFYSSLSSLSSSHSGPIPPPDPAPGIPFDDLPWNLNLPNEHYYVRLFTSPQRGWTLDHYDPSNDTGILLSSTDDPTTTVHLFHHATTVAISVEHVVELRAPRYLSLIHI